MSIWTQVNASFRVDCHPNIRNKDLIEHFGYEIHDGEPQEGVKYLPYGSEGSLTIKIWHNPNRECMDSRTVNVFGSLRNYEDEEEITKWFQDCCNSLPIRQAVCDVEIEFRKHFVLVVKNYSITNETCEIEKFTIQGESRWSRFGRRFQDLKDRMKYRT